MPTQTSRLGLTRHTTGDNFKIADYAGNWGRLDEFPGYYPCTSTTRPTWASAQAGMLIVETDTGLIWRWTGSAWARQAPVGLLGRSTRTTDISTSSTALVTALTTTVTVPAGGRSVLVVAEGGGVYSTVGITRIALLRGATTLASWLHKGAIGGGAEQPTPLAFTTVDAPPAGSNAYTLQFSAEVGIGGTSTLQGNATTDMALAVVEV